MVVSGEQFIDSYQGYVQIYTDASTSSTGGLRVALVIPEFNIKKRKKG